LQLKIAEKIAFILTGRAWIPASAGMTRSGNRQSINKIGIIRKARTRFTYELFLAIDY